MEFIDKFTVTTPTSFSAVFVITQDVGVGGAPSAGSSQSMPLLPTAPSSSGSEFAFLHAPTGGWDDPALAYGYSFQMTGASKFTRIAAFPVGVDSDGVFEVRTGGQALGSFQVGQRVDFVALTGSAISSFQVLGINPLVDGESPVAFPIKLDFDTPTADFSMTAINMVPPLAYCFGDGTTTACPCGNSGAAGNGCASSINASGANLAADGLASTADDSLVLHGTGTSNSTVTYFQGTTQMSPPTVFGDGLRCAGGTTVRLGVVPATGGTSQYPRLGDLPISIRGAIPNGGGVTRTYQGWYRNAASFCTPSTFNLSNGLSVTWTP